MEAQQLQESLAFISQHLTQRPAVAIILGSGLGGLADELSDRTILNCRDIPHYPVPRVAGHAGVWISGRLGDVPILALKGRVHTYEGYSARQVTYSIRLLAKMGVTRLVITNAAGGINPHFKPGDLMVIKDQINFLFDSPLIGDRTPAEQRFTDLFGAYDPTYVRNALAIGESLRMPLQCGVLICFRGPTYETAAEIRMARILGADATTMSTIPEVIAARQAQMRVLGISCITNMATGISQQKLSHDDVTETADRIKDQFIRFMKAVLLQLPNW
ncbi:MAG: purine-nucleoside phosphorylase [candidate division KSB1 bacterium]|nr:purine-nucleoside phosphorylase [candidate division KSB1 bacterium]